MAQHTPQQVANYYNNPANYGTFQYQNLSALVNTFLAMYVGENKIISKVDRSDVFFFPSRVRYVDGELPLRVEDACFET